MSWLPDGGSQGRLLDQQNEAIQCVTPICLLRSETLGRDDDNAFLGQATPSEPLEPRADCVWQRGRPARVETDLNRGRDLVDVLATRS
jgi:hypothetical protein